MAQVSGQVNDYTAEYAMYRDNPGRGKVIPMEPTPVDTTLYPPPLFASADFRQARQAQTPEPADLQPKLARLTEMGWEAHRQECYWLIQRGHRRIQLFLDGRVVLLDPTIRARYQFDDDWLAAIQIVGGDRRF